MLVVGRFGGLGGGGEGGGRGRDMAAVWQYLVQEYLQMFEMYRIALNFQGPKFLWIAIRE